MQVMVTENNLSNSIQFDSEVGLFVMRCVIWYHLCCLKSMKNTHRGVLFFVKLQESIPLWVFFKVFKIVQMVPNRAKHLILDQQET